MPAIFPHNLNKEKEELKFHSTFKSLIEYFIFFLKNNILIEQRIMFFSHEADLVIFSFIFHIYISKRSTVENIFTRLSHKTQDFSFYFFF